MCLSLINRYLINVCCLLAALASHAQPGLLRRTSIYSVHPRGFNLWATTGVLGQFTHVFTPDRWEGKTARNQNAFENNSDSRVEKLRHAAGVHKIDCDHRQVVAPVKTQSSVALSHSTRITPTQTVVAHRLGYKAKSSRPSPQIATPASQIWRPRRDSLNCPGLTLGTEESVHELKLLFCESIVPRLVSKPGRLVSRGNSTCAYALVTPDLITGARVIVSHAACSLIFKLLSSQTFSSLVLFACSDRIDGSAYL